MALNDNQRNGYLFLFDNFEPSELYLLWAEWLGKRAQKLRAAKSPEEPELDPEGNEAMMCDEAAKLLTMTAVMPAVLQRAYREEGARRDYSKS